MDHLSEPTEHFHAPFQIPFLAREPWEYDGLGFMGFPGRRGMSVDALRLGPTLRHTQEDLLAFMQAWLFFGLLQEVFGVCDISVVPQDFIRQAENGDQILNTAILPRLVVAWETCERSVLQSKKNEHLARIDKCISHAQEVLNQLANETWLSGALNSPDSAQVVDNAPKILLSLVVIGEAIVFARDTVYKNRMLRVPVATGGELFQRWPSLKSLDRVLQAAGWCPFEVNLLRDQVDNSCRYYLGMFGRTLEAPSHSGCTVSDCVLNKIDRFAYQTLHVTESCQCPFLTSESDNQPAVSSVLKTKHTPLITFIPSQEGPEALKVLSSQRHGVVRRVGHELKKMERENNTRWAVHQSGSRPSIPYVAISHVWRGGLGNPTTNSLPRCQLERIQNLVDSLYGSGNGPMPFWMDTLCVPLEPDTRRLAIQNMKGVYQGAEKVLVLDTFLESSNLSPSPIENLMRIRSSSWMQRLWTFQESILARSLHFQFAENACIRGEDLVEKMTSNRKVYLLEARRGIEEILRTRVKGRRVFGSFNISSLLDDPWTGRRPPRHDTVAQESYATFNAIRFANSFDSKTLLRKQHEAEVLSQLSRCLRWRRTTQSRDEAIVLTNLLGLSTKDLVDVRTELTMKRVFESMSSAPVDVLFSPREHLREAGCSWMAKTLLNGQGHTSLGLREGAVTREGFTVRLPGLILGQDVNFTSGLTILIRVAGEAKYSITPRFLESDIEVTGDATARRTDNQNTKKQWGVILRRPLAALTQVEGALVRISRVKTKRLHARWYGVFSVQPNPYEPSIDPVECTLTASDQEWLLM